MIAGALVRRRARSCRRCRRNVEALMCLDLPRPGEPIEGAAGAVIAEMRRHERQDHRRPVGNG